MASLEILAKNRIAITDLKLEGLDPLRLAMATQTLRPADQALLVAAVVVGSSLMLSAGVNVSLAAAS